MKKYIKILQVSFLVIIALIILQHRAYNAAKKKIDHIPPTIPGDLKAVLVTETMVTLEWSASYDNKGVDSYIIYKDSKKIDSSKNTRYTIKDLKPGTSYRLYIKAMDKSKNVSMASNTLTVTTKSPDFPYGKKLIVGYYAGWSVYNGYTPLDIPASKLTHINYAFAKITDDLKIVFSDQYTDLANVAKLNQLKADTPGLKTLISVGGWTYSGKFSDAALNEQSRSAFAENSIAFIKQYGFDGIDIDWEYPVGGGLSTNSNRPEDRQNFTLLLKKLRERLDAEGAKDGKKYILSFAGGAGSSYINKTQLNELSKYADYAIVMTYDLHGPWDIYTDFNAPLYTPTGSSPQYKVSVDSSVRAWMSAGFPQNKIVMGVPFYGYMYNGVKNENQGLYNTYASSLSLTYDNIISRFLSVSVRYFHNEAGVPWLFNGLSFITYDDQISIAQKANYAKENSLAGVSVWELSQNKDGALIKTLYEGLN